MTRRYSRTAAHLLTLAIREAVETVFGKAWDSLTLQQKLQEIDKFQEAGYAMRSLENVEDRNSVLEEQVTVLREKLAAAEADLNLVRKQRAAEAAKPAMAIHSKAGKR